MESEFTAGRKRTLLVLPTGTGKTVVFAELARRRVVLGGRVLVLAHRTELLEQAANKLSAAGVRATIEQGARRGSQSADVVVASVQTLRGDRLKRFAPGGFDLVVVDEAHHAAAASYQAIFEHFAGVDLLGVTATPDRADGKALGKAFDSVAFTYEMRTAIREKYLAPIRARRVLVRDLNLTDVRSHHGDFDQGDLARIMAEEKALHGVVTPLVQLAAGRKTLVFGVDVAHAHKLAEVLNRHTQASAMAIDGNATPAKRAATLSLFREGAFQFLVNCALFTEGFDEPDIACIAMARPTQSRALYTQMLGRGTRLASGKVDCLVLDFVGNTRHRLIGPADALAGFTLDDDTNAGVELEGQEVEEVLAGAEIAATDRRDRAKLVAVAHFRAKDVDPFLGDHMPPLDPNSPSGRDPATEKQIAALDAAGIGKPPPGTTKGEASAILDGLAARLRAGLATIPQCRLLGKMNVDTKTMTKERASQLIAILNKKGFRPWVLMHEPEARRGKKS